MKSVSRSLAFHTARLLALILLNSHVVHAEYAAIALQGGSTDTNSESIKAVVKLSYDFDHEVDIADASVAFNAAGLLMVNGDSEFFPNVHIFQESYASYESDRLLLRLGRQLILWGVADGFNPTDVITPRNLQMPAYGAQDSKFGVDALTSDFALKDGITLSTVVTLDKPTNLLPMGFDPSETIDQEEPYSTDDIGYGARLSWQGSLGDINLSGFQGLAINPIVVFDGAETKVTAPEITMIGADFETVFGSWRLFTETAFHQYSDGERAIDRSFMPDNEISIVTGTEYELSGANRLGVQVLYRELTTNRPDAAGPALALSNGARAIYGQFSKQQPGMSLNYHWESEDVRWVTDVTFSTWFKEDTFIRLRGKYRIGSTQSIYLYGDWFQGPENTPYGALQDTSSISFEYRYFF